MESMSEQKWEMKRHSGNRSESVVRDNSYLDQRGAREMKGEDKLKMNQNVRTADLYTPRVMVCFG